MLREASAGYYPSTTHQVVNPDTDFENVSRLSIPYFLTPKLDIRLSARYTAGSYLAERLGLLSRQSSEI
jgi:isopenicillin N synthase-like dioxygenase